MNNKEKRLLAYLAGIIDGEGSIHISSWRNPKRKHPSYTLYVQVNMADWQVPLLLCALFGGHLVIREHDVPNRYHPTLNWVISARKAYDFLQLIRSFVIIKQGQVKLALSFESLRRRSKTSASRKKNGRFLGNNGYSDGVWRRFEKLKQKLSSLNHNPTKGVKSVELLGDLRQYRAKQEDVEALKKRCLNLLEGLTTRVSSRQDNKPISAPEKDIV